METTDNTEVQGADGEMAADLKALMRAAGDDPAAQPDPEEVAAELAKPAMNVEISGALKLLSKLAAPIFPTVAAVYSDEACDAVGAAVAPVCEKHGWLQGGMMGEWGPEIMCLVVVGPMAFATYTAVQTDLAALAEKKRAKGERTGQVPDPQLAPAKPTLVPGVMRVPGSDTVSFGLPVPG